jgi:transposase-like protein
MTALPSRRFSHTAQQRCWFHLTANVLAALPKSAHPGAKAALAEIYDATRLSALFRTGACARTPPTMSSASRRRAR